MSIATAAPRGLDFLAIARTFTPAPIRFDPFGIVTGYKAFQIYTGLEAKSDRDLAAMGIARRDLPQVAMKAVNAIR